jgi:signal transduction histidine kinase
MTFAQQQKVANILIVDDSPANVLLLVRMLTERGYHPQPVLSGALALQAARADPPDLILLDINMPGMNGYEVCQRLKADAALKDIPVIFISALSETLEKVKAFQVGGVDYVTKPFQFDEVYARVQTHLQLRRLEKLRDDLTHMVIHDLRSPLAVICGVLEILELGKDKLSDSTRNFVMLARRSALELRNMISSILDVSKMNAGEMKLRRAACDIGALIRELLTATQAISRNHKLTLDALPERSLAVMADGELIRRVLQNLLSNALRYTPTGGNVRIAVTATTDEVRVTITDDGPGVAHADHQRIFDKFGQVEDHTSRTGSGLGLTFCKLAVEAHGGCIGLVSDVGEGATFWFTLPRLNDC